MTIERGTYKIIRTDGTEETVKAKPSMESIRAQIGADCLDSVNLRENSVVMLVDDGGHQAGKRINPKATKLYHGVCIRGTTHQIVGDVALVNDEDFA